ncbi:hypothetical protein LIER_05888 [Lithospermum erythrorhizon]|uniref:Pectin acetylesterase n=1 Tax=Lithospermum erythrorhizon TaxID=34254 RepID=A0AAV3P259_LITER
MVMQEMEHQNVLPSSPQPPQQRTYLGSSAVVFITSFALLVPAASTHTTLSARGGNNQSQLVVEFTYIQGAAAKGAVCLDGTLPGYNFHPGFGTGANSWLVYLEGGGWCNDIKSCLERKGGPLGSSIHMEKPYNFTGILTNKAQENPDFFNWNKVVVRYCDGACFAGEGEHEKLGLQFRGQRIYTAAMEDLMSKGMRHADQALLSGCSAGSVAVILHCDAFNSLFPRPTRVKCLSDGGLFMDTVDVSGGHHMRSLVHGVVSLQGVQRILPRSCTSRHDPVFCFFPQNLINYVRTPLFVLNAAYDYIQIQAGIAPNISDTNGKWNNGCKLNIANCSASQIKILQKFRNRMVKAVQGFSAKTQSGLFINSCFAHCQADSQDTWLSEKPPLIDNLGISLAVGDWYFDRSRVKKIDCPYPCDRTCHNRISKTSPY